MSAFVKRTYALYSVNALRLTSDRSKLIFVTFAFPKGAKAMTMRKRRKGPPAAIAQPITKEDMDAVLAGRIEALDIRTLKQRLKVESDATVYAYVQRGLLPKPVRIGGGSRWLVQPAAA
jgi:hypothetical protein